MIERYVVKVNRPDDVSVREMAEYIREAVQIWRGQLRPPDVEDGDPLWYLDTDKITVKRQT